MDKKIEKKAGYTVVTSGDVKRAEQRDGVKEILESGKFPAFKVRSRNPDPVTRAHKCMDEVVEKIVPAVQNQRMKVATSRAMGRVIDNTRKRQKEIAGSEGAKAAPMVARIPGEIFRRRVREAGGNQVLTDPKEAKKIFRDFRFD